MPISTLFLKSVIIGASVTIASIAIPASAKDAEPQPPIVINGTATLVSDYRIRGISQTDKNFAVQGSLTVTHRSGLYATVWGSSVDGYVTAANDLYAGGGGTTCCTARQEIDLIGGFRKTVGAATFDIGALYYFYPKTKARGDRTASGFIEPFAAIAYQLGSVNGKVTVNYAPKQKALSLDQIGPSRSNVYLAGDLSATLPRTPIGLTAHLGHSFGPSWLATDINGSKGYTDWALGVSATYKALTLGIQYIGTDANFQTSSGKNAGKGGLVGSLGVSF